MLLSPLAGGDGRGIPHLAAQALSRDKCPCAETGKPGDRTGQGDSGDAMFKRMLATVAGRGEGRESCLFRSTAPSDRAPSVDACVRDPGLPGATGSQIQRGVD